MVEKDKHHYVYILECKDGTLYTGYTTNVERRVKMHEQGKGAKYTRGRAPFTLMYQEKCESKTEALQLEILIKQYTRKQKLQFIKESCEKNENTKELSE